MIRKLNDLDNKQNDTGKHWILKSKIKQHKSRTDPRLKEYSIKARDETNPSVPSPSPRTRIKKKQFKILNSRWSNPRNVTHLHEQIGTLAEPQLRHGKPVGVRMKTVNPSCQAEGSSSMLVLLTLSSLYSGKRKELRTLSLSLVAREIIKGHISYPCVTEH